MALNLALWTVNKLYSRTPLGMVLTSLRVPCLLGAGVAASAATLLVTRRLMASKPKRILPPEMQNYPADTVIVLQHHRGPHAPSLSPFPLKLETYLRMANIPHKSEITNIMSSKGKTPWMLYNGVEVADSQFCIDYLNEQLGKDLNAHLTPAEKAVARAFQKMIEENTYWTLIMQRWIYNVDNWEFLCMAHETTKSDLDKRSKIRAANAHGHGMGRHSRDEVYAIARDDMAALSDFLGTKPFLMGDQPCENDCAIFGMLCQFKWHMPHSPHERMMKEDFPNLSAYCDRMKTRFWPDWDECITAGGTRTATK